MFTILIKTPPLQTPNHCPSQVTVAMCAPLVYTRPLSVHPVDTRERVFGQSPTQWTLIVASHLFGPDIPTRIPSK